MVHTDVIALAREWEPERYLAALLAPRAARPGLLALAAFSGDLRRIPHVVREPMMGEMRLQWWRDAIEGAAAAGETGHPVADAVRAAIRDYVLPAPMFVAMTEARAFDLYPEPMASEATFAGYLVKTELLPISLAERVLGVGVNPEITTAAARSYGNIRLVAELPRWLARGRLPLPPEALKAAGVDVADLLGGNTTRAALDLVRGQCLVCTTSHASLREMLSRHPAAVRLAVLPAATVPAYVAACLDPRRDPLRSPADISPLRRIGGIGRARWLGL